MLSHFRQPERVTSWVAVLAFLLSLLLASCGGGRPETKCAGTRVDGKCLSTLESHVGFELKMDKETAFDHACGLASRGEIRDPVFLIDGFLRGYAGESVCKLKGDAFASNEWSFIESGWFRDRFIVVGFVDGRIASINLRPHGLDP